MREMGENDMNFLINLDKIAQDIKNVIFVEIQALMGETKVGTSTSSQASDRNQLPKLIDPAFAKFFIQAPQKLQNFFKVGNFPYTQYLIVYKGCLANG